MKWAREGGLMGDTVDLECRRCVSAKATINHRVMWGKPVAIGRSRGISDERHGSCVSNIQV